MDALVEARAVEMTFASGRGGRQVNIHVLREISFDTAHGETLGLVGESGSGKSTMGRIVVGLHEPTAGALKLLGLALTGPNRNANLSTVRRRAQFVFQDPHAALNPRMRAGDSIAEPIDVAGAHTRRIEMIGSRNCFVWSGCRMTPLTGFRTSFPAASDSVSSSRALSLSSRCSSSATSPCRRSMSRCRPRSSTC